MVLGYGVDLTVHETARRLVGMGHAVDVWTPTSDGTYANEAYRLREVMVHGEGQNRVLALLERNARIALHILKKRLDAEGTRYDVVVSCTHPYYYAGPIFGVPQVFWNFGNVPTDGFSWKGKLNWAWLDLSEQLQLKPLSSRVVSISHFLHEQQPLEVRSRGRVVPLGGDHYWPWGNENPLEIRRSLRKDLREKLGIDAGATVIGYCGRLHKDHPRYKGVTELLETVRRIRQLEENVELLLCGIGSPADAQWAENYGAKVLLNTPPAQMPAYYSALDIYATASKWEGFDLPILEAAWHGVPAVAYNVGAHGEHVTEVPVNELRASELGRALLTLVRDPKLRRQLGSEAFRKARGFSWDRSARLFADVLAEVAS
jgi:glycosyltransferase involved in cell wall biosynthesis